jgi:hypothetical protein
MNSEGTKRKKRTRKTRKTRFLYKSLCAVIKDHLDELNWFLLSGNPGAIRLLLEYPNRVLYSGLANNTNPVALEILKNSSFFKDTQLEYFLETSSVYFTILKNLAQNPTKEAVELLTDKLGDRLYTNTDIKFDLWYYLSGNPAAIHLVEEELATYPNSDLIDWENLSKNPAAIHLLEEEAKKPGGGRIDWNYLSNNTAAIHLLEEEATKPGGGRINWYYLSQNTAAIHLLKKETNLFFNRKVFWKYLSTNPAAIHLLEEEASKPGGGRINWDYLSKNPAAVPLLEKEDEKYPETINWVFLSKNPAAIHLLEKEAGKPNGGRINWNGLSQNPNICNKTPTLKDLSLLTLHKVLPSMRNKKQRSLISNINYYNQY